MKKPTAKQIAARKKFAAIMKSGGFKKRRAARPPAKKVAAKKVARRRNPEVERKIGIVRAKRRTNPLRYAVKVGTATHQKTVGRCDSEKSAKAYARALAREHPNKHIKVVLE